MDVTGVVKSIRKIEKKSGKFVLRCVVDYTDCAPDLALSIVWDRTPVRIVPIPSTGKDPRHE